MPRIDVPIHQLIPLREGQGVAVLCAEPTWALASTDLINDPMNRRPCDACLFLLRVDPSCVAGNEETPL